MFTQEFMQEYLPYLEGLLLRDAVSWVGEGHGDDGATQMPYPVYEHKLAELMSQLAGSSLMDSDYLATLADLDLSTMERIQGVAARAEMPVVRGLVTYLVRQERFCPGLWGVAAREGVLLTLLTRLGELTLAKESPEKRQDDSHI